MKSKFYTKFSMVFTALAMFAFIATAQETTITSVIAASEDDAEEFTADVLDDAGAVDEPKGKSGTSSSDLELCNEDGPQLVGMIFRDVQIPVGAVILNAYVQFMADDDNDEEITVDFFGAAVANVTAAFTGADFEISSYTQTTARVEWKPDFWTAGDVGLEDAELMRSPDISSVIAEIVAIEGWAAGNGVLIMAQDPDQVDKMHREAESWDGATDDNAGVGKPTLNVTYVVYPASVDAGAEFANTIFPNPTEGLVTIVNPSTDKFSYSIYSVTGKMIASRDNLSGTEINVDMTDFAKGMYLVDVRSANKSEVHKLMVK